MTKRFGLLLGATLLFAGTANADTPKLHPVESYTAVYKQEGMMKGEYTEYCREHCYERVEVEQYQIEAGGTKLPGEHRRIISKGKERSIVDFNRKNVTEMQNPFYDELVSHVEKSGPSTAAREFMEMNGGVDTGETKKIGEWSCTVWKNEQAGTEMCMTEEMITVEMVVNLGGMKFTRTLTKFDRGNSGDDDLYQIPEDFATNAIQVPNNAPGNMNELLKAIMPAAE